MKSIFSRVILLVAFAILALALFLPSTPISGSLPNAWVNYMTKITLGLDLQGGMHIVLEVDQEKAVETHLERLTESVKGALRDERVPISRVRNRGSEALIISYSTGANVRVVQAIKELVGKDFTMLENPEEKPGSITYALTFDESERIKDWSTSQALETIRNRIDEFGVTEPVIQRQGAREIVIQLPGLKDPERAINLIGKTAILEFRLLDEQGDITNALKGVVPRGSELIYQRRENAETGIADMIPYLVKRETLLTGDLISEARVAFDSQMSEPYVSINFNRQGGKIFSRITGQNVGKRLAIILDGTLYSAPVIKEKIGGGRASVSGRFSSEEAADLAIALRAGALPAPLNIIQNVTVGPSLGQDSIDAGIRAVMLGCILVLIFMLIYYKVAGLIAVVALVLNVLMLMGAMAYFHATLTLPGIAGILLTIGMGVDANVLIFERIKEELRAGRTPRSAVDAGYERAWWTIVDSQVTTLITAAVLFQFGSGPIKGFAVTLSLGILINLFTALVGTKLAFDIQNVKLRVKKLSI